MDDAAAVEVGQGQEQLAAPSDSGGMRDLAAGIHEGLAIGQRVAMQLTKDARLLHDCVRIGGGLYPTLR